MTSLSGKYLFNERPFELSILDIARHLGRVVRFAGAVDTYWSVLQHSLLVADLMLAIAGDHGYLDQGADPVHVKRLQLLALFHDAHEFITGDVPTPWKLPEICRQQEEIDRLIAAAVGLPMFGQREYELVKEADTLSLKVEAHFVATTVAAAKPEKFGLYADVIKFAPVIKRYGGSRQVGGGSGPILNFEACWFADGAYVQTFHKWARELLDAVRSA